MSSEKSSFRAFTIFPRGRLTSMRCRAIRVLALTTSARCTQMRAVVCTALTVIMSIEQVDASPRAAHRFPRCRTRPEDLVSESQPKAPSSSQNGHSPLPLPPRSRILTQDLRDPLLSPPQSAPAHTSSDLSGLQATHEVHQLRTGLLISGHRCRSLRFRLDWRMPGAFACVLASRSHSPLRQTA